MEQYFFYQNRSENVTKELLAQMGPPPPGEETRQEIEYPDNPYVEDSNGINFISIFIWLLIVVLVVGVISIGVVLYAKYLKKKDQEEKTKEGVLFEVQAPKGNEIEIGVAEQMFANLYGIGGAGKGVKKHLTVNNAISFEIVSLPGEIRFFVYAPKNLADLVEKQILGSYQDAEVTVLDEHNIFHEEGEVAFAQLELTDERYYPIKVAEDFKGDPLANILSTLSKMGEKEGALVQILISPAGSDWQKAGRKYVNKVESNNADPEKKRISVSQEQLQAISKKTGKIGFETSIRVVASAPNKEISKMHVSNIIGAFDQFSNPGINNLKKKLI